MVSMLSAILLTPMTWLQMVPVTVSIVLLWRWLSRKRYNLPPGPKALPYFGSNLQQDGLKPRQTIDKWRAKYGPVFLFYRGPKPVVYIADIDVLNEAYLARDNAFANKPSLTSLNIISHGGRNLAFSRYNQTQVAHRKMTMQALRTYLTGDQLAERANEAVVMALSSLPSGPFDPQPILGHIIFNIIHGIVFGYIVKRDDQVFIDMYRTLDSINEFFMGIREDVFPFLKHVCPSEKYKTLLAFMEFLNNYFDQQFRKNEEEFDPAHITNLVQNFIMVRREANKENLPEKYQHFTEIHALAISQDIFLAGNTTTRHTLAWLFLILANQQDIQEKVYQEIKEVVGESVPSRSHRHQLVYLEACIMETQRLYPAVPFGLMHETTKDTKLMDYDIPAQTQIMADIMAIHRDPEHWEDPDKFKPERFIEKNGNKLVTKNRSWIPFNIGPRSCAGEFLARQQLVLVTTGILQKMKVTLPEGEKANFDYDDTWFLLSIQPYKIHFTPRP